MNEIGKRNRVNTLMVPGMTNSPKINCSMSPEKTNDNVITSKDIT